jgi:hypothetical protein
MNCRAATVYLANLIRLRVRKYEASEFADELAEAVRTAEYQRKIAELGAKNQQLEMPYGPVHFSGFYVPSPRGSLQ